MKERYFLTPAALDAATERGDGSVISHGSEEAMGTDGAAREKESMVAENQKGTESPLGPSCTGTSAAASTVVGSIAARYVSAIAQLQGCQRAKGQGHCGDRGSLRRGEVTGGTRGSSTLGHGRYKQRRTGIRSGDREVSQW